MTNQIRLTRKLYLFDEVKYTLLNNLTHKKCEFNECVFWTCELFESGFVEELCETLFEIYYNFYAINYPKYESKINQKIKKKELKSILYVVNLLFYTPRISTKVFEIYTKAPNKISQIYLTKHKHFAFLKSLDIDKSYYKFIAAIHQNNFTNIMFYIRNNTYSDINGLYDAIKKYFKNVKMMKLSDKLLQNNNYSDKMHIIIAVICYLKEDINSINKRKIFRKFSYELYENTIDSFKINSKENNYTKLKNSKLYYISNNIGCFHLQRFKVKHIKNEIRYYWDFHCYNSPLWKNRLDKYKIKVDGKKKLLIFEDIDEEEEFYELYDYEFDEQTKELQDCIIPEIKQITIEQWLDKLKN